MAGEETGGEGREEKGEGRRERGGGRDDTPPAIPGSATDNYDVVKFILF